jgi:hypothetical protein
MVDFSRLSTNWIEWASRLGLPDISVSTECDDCQILFRSKDYSVHLRCEDHWWLVDTVDDRGERSDADAQLSTFDLAEKYLIWRWVTLARSSLASGPLGADLYRQGYAHGIAVSDVDGAHIKAMLAGRLRYSNRRHCHNLQSYHVEIRGADRADGAERYHVVNL